MSNTSRAKMVDGSEMLKIVATSLYNTAILEAHPDQFVLSIEDGSMHLMEKDGGYKFSSFTDAAVFMSLGAATVVRDRWNMINGKEVKFRVKIVARDVAQRRAVAKMVESVRLMADFVEQGTQV